MRTREAVRIYLILAPLSGLAPAGMGILGDGLSFLARRSPGLQALAVRLGVSPETLWAALIVSCFLLFAAGLRTALEAARAFEKAAAERRLSTAGAWLLALIFFAETVLAGFVLYIWMSPWVWFLKHGYGTTCLHCV